MTTNELAALTNDQLEQALSDALLTLLTSIRATPVSWSRVGPWTYSLFGNGRNSRAEQLKKYLDAHNMAYRTDNHPYCIHIRFMAPDFSLPALANSVEITPNLPLCPPASHHLEDSDAENLRTPALAVPGEGC